jgi:hypothetical protein
MKEKILAFLKTKLTGVQEAFLSGVADEFSKTIKEEKEIETVFTDGVISSIKFSAGAIQSEGDKRATDATKTAIENYRKKHNLDENGLPIKKGDDDSHKDQKSGDTQTAKQIKELTDKVNLFESEKKSQKLLSDLHKKLTEKKIPILLAKGVKLEKEEDIDAAITAIETDFNSVKQDLINEKVLIENPAVAQGASSKTHVEQEIKANARWDDQPKPKV